jgi:hypothetical protein
MLKTMSTPANVERALHDSDEEPSLRFGYVRAVSNTRTS